MIHLCIIMYTCLYQVSRCLVSRCEEVRDEVHCVTSINKKTDKKYLQLPEVMYFEDYVFVAYLL